jgi:hypothetical protein
MKLKHPSRIADCFIDVCSQFAEAHKTDGSNDA